eukprot:jgi/Botrbrau1/5572/Bobra.97_2s0003.1
MVSSVCQYEFIAGRKTCSMDVRRSVGWHNYRHALNALSVHNHLLRLGVPPSQTILMLAVDHACDARNPFPGIMRSTSEPFTNLYCSGSSVLRDITVAAVLAVISGLCQAVLLLTISWVLAFGVPLVDFTIPHGARLVVYLTGHGGNGFLKFKDREELTSEQLGKALAQRASSTQLSHVLLLIDTCQAASLFSAISIPSFLGLASSAIGESSYSHHMDPLLGVAEIDRFTFHLSEFLASLKPCTNASIGRLIEYLREKDLKSTLTIRAIGLPANLHAVPLNKFVVCPQSVVTDALGRRETVSSASLFQTHIPEANGITEGILLRSTRVEGMSNAREASGITDAFLPKAMRKDRIQSCTKPCIPHYAASGIGMGQGIDAIQEERLDNRLLKNMSLSPVVEDRQLWEQINTGIKNRISGLGQRQTFSVDNTLKLKACTGCYRQETVLTFEETSQEKQDMTTPGRRQDTPDWLVIGLVTGLCILSYIMGLFQ